VRLVAGAARSERKRGSVLWQSVSTQEDVDAPSAAHPLLWVAVALVVCVVAAVLFIAPRILGHAGCKYHEAREGIPYENWVGMPIIEVPKPPGVTIAIRYAPSSEPEGTVVAVSSCASSWTSGKGADGVYVVVSRGN
jgi:hypothetical protein